MKTFGIAWAIGTGIVAAGQASVLDISTTSLPGGMTMLPYTATLTATGGVTPYVWSIVTEYTGCETDFCIRRRSEGCAGSARTHRSGGNRAF